MAVGSLFASESFCDRFAKRSTDPLDSADFSGRSGTYLADAAKVPQEPCPKHWSNPWNGVELGLEGALLTALAMVSHGKPVRLVTKLL